MDISFDPAKNARNVDVHGVSFEFVREFDWSVALILEDIRRDYGERRYRALGSIYGRLYVLVFSLRKANKREIRLYASQTQSETNGNGS